MATIRAATCKSMAGKQPIKPHSSPSCKHAVRTFVHQGALSNSLEQPQIADEYVPAVRLLTRAKKAATASALSCNPNLQDIKTLVQHLDMPISHTSTHVVSATCRLQLPQHLPTEHSRGVSGDALLQTTFAKPTCTARPCWQQPAAHEQAA